MSGASPGPLLIAEFARRCRPPVSTLRYYDRIGLLRPAEVVPGTGYRRYGVDQLPSAITIAALRAIGTAPEAIAAILAGGDVATARIAAERRRITAQISEGTRALARLDELLAGSVGSAASAVRPCAISLPDAVVPTLAFTTPFAGLAEAITRGVARLRTRLRREAIEPDGWGALLPLDLGERVDGRVFARIAARTANQAAVTAAGPWPIAPSAERPATPPADRSAAAVRRVALPLGPAVSGRHSGRLDELPLAYAAVLAEIERRGGQPIGPVIEDYPTHQADGADRGGIQVTVPMRSRHGGPRRAHRRPA